MTTVHLCMMELKRHGECGLEQSLTISAPSDERIIIDATVLIDDTVQLYLWQCGCPYNHITVQGTALTGLGSLTGQRDVGIVELMDIVIVRNVTQTDASLRVFYHDIDGQPVKSVHLSVLWQYVELLHLTRCFADAPAHQRGKSDAGLLADLYQSAHDQCLHQCYHGHWRLHPHAESLGSIGVLRIDFLLHRLFLPAKVIIIQRKCLTL